VSFLQRLLVTVWRARGATPTCRETIRRRAYFMCAIVTGTPWTRAVLGLTRALLRGQAGAFHAAEKL
jgi:hypothetical protein